MFNVRSEDSLKLISHGQSQLTFVDTHFKSCDPFLDKTSFDFSNIFRAMQSCARSVKGSIILRLPNIMGT